MPGHQLVTYKAMHNIGPGYLNECWPPIVSWHFLAVGVVHYASIKCCQLVGPSKHAFSVVAPTLWNGMPLKIRTVVSLLGFQKTLKTCLWFPGWELISYCLSGSLFSLIYIVYKIVLVWAVHLV